ncbi:MAG: TrmH family RNA methyltransferase, partial [Acidimicrobiia bacterium]
VTSQAVFAEVAAHIAALDDVSFWGITPVVVLVDVQDPGNVGTILRAAEAAGVSTIVAVGDTVDCWNPKVVRASAGALGGLTLVEAREPQPALDTLRANGFVTVSTVVRGGQAPDVVDLAGPIALVVGSEAHGLDPDVAHACDLHVTIPMTGASESLNAAVATSVLLFEAARQRRWDQE